MLSVAKLGSWFRNFLNFQISILLLLFVVSCNSETDEDGSQLINYDQGQVRPPSFRGFSIPENLVKNSSFELNTITTESGAKKFFTIDNWGRDPKRGSGFTLFKGVHLENIAPTHGYTKVALSGDENASLMQTISVIPGKKYHLFFDYVPRNENGSHEFLKVFLNNDLVSDLSADGNRKWETFHYTFTATTTSVELSFVGGGNRGMFVDNVKLYNWDVDLKNNLVVNAEFNETVETDNNTFVDLSDVNGWTSNFTRFKPAVELSVGRINTLSPSDGDIKLELEAFDGNAVISQEVSVIAGEEHHFSIDYARSKMQVGDSNEIEFLVDGVSKGVFSNNSITKSWNKFNYKFTPNSDKVKLTLKAIGSEDTHAGMLDNAFFGKTGGVNTLINPSFESGSTLLPIRGKFTEHVESMPGWKIEEVEKRVPFRILKGRSLGGISPVSGEHKLKLDGLNNSIVTQNIATEANKIYLISLHYAPEKVADMNTNIASVLWNGNERLTLNSNQKKWHEYSFIAQGAQTSSLLSFKAGGKSDGLGALIDKVSVREITGITNVAPVLAGGTSFILPPNLPFSFSLPIATDVDNDTIQSYHLTSNPESGILSDCIEDDVLDLDCTFTPESNFEGAVFFKYRAFDGAIYSNEVEVALYVETVESNVPVIQLTSEDGHLTNNPKYDLEFNITDESTTHTVVKHSGQESEVIFSKDFKYQIDLVEGINQIEIHSTDVFGNVAVVKTLNDIILDTVPPEITFHQDGTQTLRNANVVLKADASEEVVLATANGIEGTILESNFEIEIPYTFMSEGTHSVEYIIVDKAGNESKKTLDYKVKEHILNMSLISVTPHDGKLRITGAPGAVDRGLTVNVSTGFFSGVDTVAELDGSFVVDVELFTEAEVSVYSPEYDLTEKGNLSYEVDTTFAGTIRDVNGATLPGVTVTIVSSGQSSVTGINGVFSIESPVTGDQRVAIDGGTIPSSYDENKEFSETFINVSIGHLQQNVLKEDIYLTPKMIDGSETAIIAGQSAVVDSPHAPGVQLDIPADSANFPSGSNEGSINIMAVDARKSSVSLPDQIQPSTIIALEPSGMHFDERVAVELPNDNDLPDGTEMVILSKNSDTGQWEVDGAATVEGDKVVTKEGQGISHFSEIFAVPFGMEMKKFGPKDKPGITNDEGAVSSNVTLPSFKVMGQDITPSLNYKSTWAHPLATIKNVFDIPRKELTHTDWGTQGGLFGIQKSEANIQSWIQPEWIESQFFSGNVVSDKIRFTGMPNKSVVAYSMDLSELDSGIYPARSTYVMQLKHMVIGTQRSVSRDLFGKRTVKVENIDNSKLLDLIFPPDLETTIYHNNKKNSPYGAGWHLSGSMKILNPANNRLALESSDGSIKAYTLQNTLETIFNDEEGVESFTVAEDGITYASSKGEIKLQEFLREGEETLPDAEVLRTTSSYQGTVGVNSMTFIREGDFCCKSGIFGCEKRCTDYQYRCERRTFTHDIDKKFKSIIDIGGNNFITLDENGAIYNVGESETRIAGLYTGINRIDKISQSTSISFEPECKDRIHNTCINESNYQAHTFWIDYNRATSIGSCGFGYRESSGNFPKKGYDNGALNSTSFNTPLSMVEGVSSDILYVADYGNNLVRKINLSTGQSSNFAGNRQTYDNGDGGPATSASLYHPTGITRDSLGNVYVTTENGYVRKVSPDGTISTFAGLPEGDVNAILADSSDMRFTSLKAPAGIVIDEENSYMYIADSGHNRILQLDLLDGTAKTIAGNGTCSGDSFDGDSALSISICSPKFIALDKEKNILFLDNDGKRVRRVNINTESEGVKRFASTSNDNSYILQNSDKSFDLVSRDGIKSFFTSSGLLQETVDRLGNSTKFYYQDGLLSEVKYPTNKSLLINYIGGMISSIEDPSGRITSFTHLDGELTSVNFSDNTSESFTYNEHKMLTQKTNKRQYSTRFEYNVLGQYKKTIYPSSDETSMISFLASIVSFESEEEDPEPKELKSLDDEDNPLIDVYTDAKGVSTRMKKDTSGYVQEITDSKDRTSFIERDTEGRPTKITKFDKTYVEFSYNEFGDLVYKHDSESGDVESFDYNEDGNLTRYRNKLLRDKFNYYDNDTGLLIQEKDFQGNSIYKTYYPNGQLKTVYNDKGETTRFLYNSDGNLSQKISPEGEITSYIRDIAGNIISKENSNGVITLYTYDDFNRLTSVATGVTDQDPIGKLTSYSYTLTGQLASIIDPESNTTLFEYDSMDRLIKKTTPLGQITELDYDGNNNIVWEKDAKGNVKTYEYSDENLLTKKILPDNTYMMSYDDYGNMLSISDDDSLVEFSYEKVAKEFYVSSTTTNGTDIPEQTLTYAYNTLGSRTNMTSSFGTFSYGYDLNERLISLANHKNESFTFNYDETNRLTSILRPGSTTDYSFDANSFLTNISHQKTSSDSINSFTYTRDDLGNRTSITTARGVASYTYDEESQLKTVSNTEVTSGSYQNESFNYDSLGNRLNDQLGTYVYDAKKQRLTEDFKYTYLYDDNGNLSSRQEKGMTGNLVNYTYSSENQLVEINTYVNNILTKTSSYKYDALGRRMHKIITDHQNSSKSFERKYIYDGQEILAELDKNNAALAVYTHSTLRTDDVLAVDVKSTNLAPSTGSFFYLKDGLGSIVDVVDSSGNLYQHYVYSSFGKILKIEDGNGINRTTNPLLKTSYTYTNREYDEESGMYYYRARFYSPEIGRFISEDAHQGDMKTPGTKINKYIYALNNPMRYVDPSGNFVFTGMIVGAILGGYMAHTSGGNIIEGMVVGAIAGAIGGYAGKLGNYIGSFAPYSLGGITGSIVGVAIGAPIGAALGSIVGGNLSLMGGRSYREGSRQGGNIGAATATVTGAMYGFSPDVWGADHAISEYIDESYLLFKNVNKDPLALITKRPWVVTGTVMFLANQFVCEDDERYGQGKGCIK